MADCVLHMTTRERLSSKIANFTTEVSAQLLLDTLGERLTGPTDVVLPTRLVVRGSTGSPRTGP